MNTPQRILTQTAALLLGLFPASLALAQTPGAADDEPIDLETITVTGSNIRGVDTEKILPVMVFSADDITNSGVGTFAELVEAMPYSTSVSINESSTGPNDAGGCLRME
jgi:iron complex outermembrane receptor protein